MKPKMGRGAFQQQLIALVDELKVLRQEALAPKASLSVMAERDRKEGEILGLVRRYRKEK